MRFYAFRFDCDGSTLAHSPKGSPRIAGNLYCFSTKRERDDYVAGRDLPDHLDSYAAPCDGSQGEYRAAIESTGMPKGWKTHDAINQKFNKNLNQDQAA